MLPSCFGLEEGWFGFRGGMEVLLFLKDEVCEFGGRFGGGGEKVGEGKTTHEGSVAICTGIYIAPRITGIAL